MLGWLWPFTALRENAELKARLQEMEAEKAASSIDLLASARGIGGLPFGRSQDMSQSAMALKEYRSWVYASVRCIASRVASQRLCLGRIKPKPGRLKSRQPAIQEIDQHPILEMWRDPSELSTSWATAYSLTASVLLTGKGFLYMPELQGRRRAFVIPPSWVEDFTGSTSYETWVVRPPHQADATEVPSDEMLYLPLPNPADPFSTTSPVQAAAHAITADLSLQKSQVATFNKGLFPSLALYVGQTIDATGKPTGKRPVLSGAQREALVTSIRRANAGVLASGDPLILDGLVERADKLSHAPNECDWLNSAEAFKARILGAFGVSEINLGGVLNANRASATEANRHLAENIVNPLLALWSESMQAWLPPLFGEDPATFKVWIEPVVVKDEELDLKRADLLLRGRAGTVDEFRAFIGLGPAAYGGEQLIQPSDDPFMAQIERQTSEQIGAWGVSMLTRRIAERAAQNGHAH